MRAKKLRNREQDFVKPAAVKANRKRPWGKYFYVAVLIGFAFSILQWGVDKTLYIKGVGFLEAETSMVSARNTGRISKIFCAVNDTILVGDLLVALDSKDTLDTDVIPVHGDFYSNERKLIDSQKKIAILEEREQQAEISLELAQNEYGRRGQLFRVKAITSSDYVEIDQLLQKQKRLLAELRIELKSERKILRSYRNQYHSYLLSQDGIENNIMLETKLHSTEPGVISEVFQMLGDVVRTGEAIFEIIDMSKGTVRGYFEGNVERQIFVGDKVIIKYENGDEESGVIQKIHPVTDIQPPEIKHKFGKERRFIIAEIEPERKDGGSRIRGTQVELYIRKKVF